LLSSRLNRALKRSLDLVVSICGLLLLSPIFLVTALLVKMTSPGPIFYVGTRVGLNGMLFGCYKFRTMQVGADVAGPGITRHCDDRITPVGRFLRSTKIDELPQLINVLKGQMSLVGPRPEDPRYVATYTPQQRSVLAVPPGLTSLASIRYRNEEALLTGEDAERVYFEQIMPDKLRIDQRYLENWSLGLDLRILLYTFVILPSLHDVDLL
jgi:lipopolysaccharide/colanic/teichoic acid biosynthesis glycosyltransferase